MSLSIGDSARHHNARRRRRPGRRAHQSHAPGARKLVSRLSRRCASDTFSVTAIDVSAHDTAAHVRVTVSFHADGHEPWTTAGVSSDLNQAALMAIVDGFHYWLLNGAA